MALGPNHKRNNNKGEQFVAAKIIRAKKDADQFSSSLALDPTMAVRRSEMIFNRFKAFP